MSYGEGLFVLRDQDPVTIQVEAAAADYNEYLMPVDHTVLAFGVVVTEDFVSQSTAFVIKLQQRQLAGGASTTLATLTIGNAETSLKKGDGTRPGQTALTSATDIDVGHVVLADGLPKSGRSGEYLAFEVTQAAGSAGGAVHPFAVLRIDGGPDTRQTNVWIKNAS